MVKRKNNLLTDPATTTNASKKVKQGTETEGSEGLTRRNARSKNFAGRNKALRWSVQEENSVRALTEVKTRQIRSCETSWKQFGLLFSCPPGPLGYGCGCF